MSIRAKLAAAMAALSLIIAVHAFQHVLDGIAAFQNAERGQRLTGAAHHFYNATGRYALERGVTNMLLRDPTLGSPEIRQALVEARAQADESLARGIREAQALIQEPAVQESVAAIAEMQSDLAGWRAEVDQALASGERAPERLIGDWFPAMNGFIATMQPLRGFLESRMSLDDSAMVSGLLAMRSTFEAAEYLGRERGMLAGILADRRAMTEQERIDLWQGRGRINAAWGVASGHGINLGPKYAAAVDKANRAIFEEMEVLRRETLQQIASGSPSSGAFQWFRESTVAIDSLRVVRAAAADRIVEANARRTEEAVSTLTVSFGIILILLASGGLFYFFINRHVTRPLEAVFEALERLERKDFGFELGALPQHRDEVGRLARAVLHLGETIRENEALTAQQESLRAEAERRRREGLALMTESVDRESAVVAQAIAEQGVAIARRADRLALMMDHMSEHAKSVAEAAGSALESVDSVAETARKISDDIAAIGGQAGQASEGLRDAVEAGHDARARIASLEEAVGQIGEVAELIGTVARKTNMLALNATIEAARAGAAGKGFAVVATEVKSLAGQTAQATEEVGRLVSAIREAMQGVTASVGEIEGRIGGIDQIAAEIAAAVNEQAGSAQKIAADVAETAAAARDVSEHIESVAKQTSDGRSLARDVRTTFAGMHERVDQLQHELARLVRNAAASADRAVAERFTVQQEIVIVSGVGRHRGRSIDLSVGGARVDIGGALDRGTSVTLVIPAWSLEVPAEVVGMTGQALRMKFDADLSGEVRTALERRLAALGGGMKAA